MGRGDYDRKLIEDIKRRLPTSTKIVDVLIESLELSKESAYRRLRGEVPFTFEEIAILAKNYGISLDSLLGIGIQKSKPFQLKLPEFINPKAEDYFLFNDYISFLKKVADWPDTELGLASNVIPQNIFCGFEYLMKFNVFKWQYYYHNNNIIPYSDLNIDKEVVGLMKEHFIEFKNMKKIYYVFDNSIFRKTVEELKYFHSIHLISDEDIQVIKEDLYKVLDYIETLTIEGRFRETNNNVLVYISDIDIVDSFTYVKTNEICYSLIDAFLLTSITSYEDKTFEKVRGWIHAIMRTATLITHTNEMVRITYFRNQRAIVEELSGIKSA